MLAANHARPAPVLASCTSTRRGRSNTRPVRLPRPAAPRLLRRLGPRRRRHRRHPASAAGRDPYDRDLSDLVGELSTRSEAFRTRWAAHNVRFHHTGIKTFHHPVVGELTLTYERLDLAADSGLAIFTYTAEPGSKSAEALDLLASWTATIEATDASKTPERTS